MRFYSLSILLVILIISSCKKDSSNSYPEYYQLYKAAVYESKSDNIEKALELFQQAEKLVNTIPPMHYIKGARLANDVNNCNLVFKYYQAALDNGLEYDEDWMLLEDCPTLKKSMLVSKEFDVEYQKIINDLYNKDQNARGGGEYEKMAVVDSVNISTLLRLIEEKGFPSPAKVGLKSADNAFIIMLHFDDDIGNEILNPIITKAYENGEFAPENLAWIVDRRRSWGPDRLDPYYYQLPTKKYFELNEIEIEEINQRRYSIGLGALSEMNITKSEGGGISYTQSFTY